MSDINTKKLTINGKEVEFTDEPNLLEVIKKAGLQNRKLDVFESRILDLDVNMAKKEYQNVLSVVNEEIADIEQYGFGLNK